MKNIFHSDHPWMLTITCQGCGGRIRFPLNKGKIRVRCPWCLSWFVFSWHPAHLWDLAKRLAGAFFRKRTAFKSAPAATASPHSESIKVKMIIILIAAAAIVIIMNVCNGPLPATP
jgi:heme O synthase-like polyprenyltransferase